jgi:protein TonB
VNARGDVDQVEVIESSGTPALDSAAREAVLRWKFEPGRRGDTPVACRVTVPVHFRLD